VQQFDDSRSQGFGVTTTEPEQEQHSEAELIKPSANAGADVSAAPPPAPYQGSAVRPVATSGAVPEGGENDDAEMTMAALLDSPGNAMHELQRGDVVEGVVARIDADEVLVDIGQKSEGVISNKELGPAGEGGNLRVGQQVLVYVMQPESSEGHAILSLKRARMEQSWREAEAIMNADRVVEAPVIDYNKGGLIVDVGVRGFVPISQIPELRGLAKGPDSGDSPQVAERLAAMRGRVLKLKIIELNRARNRLILSERLAMQEARAEKKEALLHELEPGQIRTGRVTSLASFGAFIDLGGADGLVHISQLSYSRVNHPNEVLKVGDEVQVYVLSIDPQTKKIALSLKKAQPDPWTLVEERYKIGDVVEGTITKLAKFGAFARIDDGIEGLIHLSELADHPIEKPQDVVSEGQEVKLRVIAINSQRRRLGLSLRQAQGDTLRPVEVPENFDDIVDASEESGEADLPEPARDRPAVENSAAPPAPAPTGDQATVENRAAPAVDAASAPVEQTNTAEVVAVPEELPSEAQVTAGETAASPPTAQASAPLGEPEAPATGVPEAHGQDVKE